MRDRDQHHSRNYDNEIVISTLDMPNKMVDFIMEKFVDCLCKGMHPKKMCRRIREECNRKYGASWDCFVSKEYYGSFAYVPRHLISFRFNGLSFLIFKGA
uniref:Dynein light chain n=1 Tax=Mesocestoides corti TaxID=53468 RepID=A0A5K3FC23_MESCO